jgi:hypothetical protein
MSTRQTRIRIAAWPDGQYRARKKIVTNVASRITQRYPEIASYVDTPSGS